MEVFIDDRENQIDARKLLLTAIMTKLECAAMKAPKPEVH
jgi:hypothetical protein